MQGVEYGLLDQTSEGMAPLSQLQFNLLRGRIEPGDPKAANLSRVDGFRLRCSSARAALPTRLQHGSERREICLRCGWGFLLRGTIRGDSADRVNAFPKFYARLFARNLHHPARDDATFLSFGDVFLDAGGDQLLHPQFQPPLLGVDFEYLRFHRLPDLQQVLRVIDALFGAHVADVNHAFDAFGELNESAEFGEAGDWTFDRRTHGELRYYVGPGITERLLQTQRDTALIRFNAQNHGFDGLAGFNHIAGRLHLLYPGHFRDVDQAFNPRLEFHKRAEVHYAGNGTADTVARHVFCWRRILRIWLKMFHPDGDATLLRINLQNLDIDLLPPREHVGWLADTASRNITDVQQGVHATNINDRPVICQAANRAMHDCAFLDLRVATPFRRAFFLFEHHAAVNYQVLVGLVEFGDPAADLLFYQLLHLGGVAHAAA